MENQTSSLLIPSEWQEKFLLKRIDEEDIELTLEQRNAILDSLEKGARFVQIRKYTIMLNSIKSIDPMWGGDNVPPRPREITTEAVIENGKAVMKITNQAEIDLWFKLFGKMAIDKPRTNQFQEK